MKKVICILGMHRSGTSMLTRMLNLCGMGLGNPENLVKNGSTRIEAGNKKGHWENREFIEINERLLEACATYPISSVPGLDHGFFLRDDVKQLEIGARKLVEKMDVAHALWGWKDPRTCLTFNFWKKILDDRLVCIAPLRHSFDVADSLYRRDDRPLISGLYMWSDYVFSSYNSTIGSDVYWFYVDNLFKDWKDELTKMISFVKLPALKLDKKRIKEIDEFISVDMWHGLKRNYFIRCDDKNLSEKSNLEKFLLNELLYIQNESRLYEAADNL